METPLPLMERITQALGVVGAGAILLKIADKLIPDASKRGDDQALFRKELREESSGLRNELKQSRLDYVEVQKRFTELANAHLELQLRHAKLEYDMKTITAKYEASLAALRFECEELRLRIDKMQS